MEDYNSFNRSSWYAPAEPERSSAQEIPETGKKKNKTARIISLILVISILLGAAGYGMFGLKKPVVHFESWSYDSRDGESGNTDSDLPENFHDFFAQYYTVTEDSNNTEVYIGKYEGEVSFDPDLKKASGEELDLSALYEKQYEEVVHSFFSILCCIC